MIDFSDVIEELWGDEEFGIGKELIALLSESRELKPQVGHTSEDGMVHAILGASSSDRWMKCPGSIRMSKGMPNRSSVYAQEGTCAHHLCEISLSSDVEPHWFIGQWITIKGDLLDDAPVETEDDSMIAFEVDEEMADCVALYIATIEAIFQELALAFPDKEVLRFLEKSFDLSRLYPDMFGRNDYSLFVIGETLVVVDYKHGRGKVVEAKNNSQLLYYALGAILEVCKSVADLPKRVRTILVQPRAAHKDGPVRSWEYDIEEVIAFSRDLVAAAKATEDPNAPLVPGETQCFFCPGKARPCPAVIKRASELAMQDFADLDDSELTLPPVKATETLLSAKGQALADEMVQNTLSDSELLLKVLRFAPVFDAWIRDVQAFAQHEYENGRSLSTDFKLVRKRTNRKHRDEKESVAYLRNSGIPDKDIFKEPKIKTPAQLEKIKAIGKDMVSEIVFQPPGQLTLVSKDDARPGVEMTPFLDLADSEMVIEGEFTVVEEPDFALLTFDSEEAWDIL